jgi:hypothetical protein
MAGKNNGVQVDRLVSIVTLVCIVLLTTITVAKHDGVALPGTSRKARSSGIGQRLPEIGSVSFSASKNTVVLFISGRLQVLSRQ